MAASDEPFEVRGINHFALVCSDMDRTVEFYSGILGFPLTKTLELPNGLGKHFFFDIGVGTGPQLGFFWFPDGPGVQPGVTSPATFPDQKGEFATAVGSLNHLAFDVPCESLPEYRERLKAKGVKVTRIINHDHSVKQYSEHPHDDVFVRSIYFFDPDGILLEFACWARTLTEEDVHLPSAAQDDLTKAADEIRRASQRRGAEQSSGDAPFM